jgi:hypothetical protein
LVTGNSINNYEMSCEMFWTSSCFASFVYGADDSGIYGKVIQFQATQGIYLYSNLDTSSGTKIYTGTFAPNVWHSFRVIVNSTHVSVYENESFLVSSSLHSTLGLMGVGSYYSASGTYMRNFVVDDYDWVPYDAVITADDTTGQTPFYVTFTDESTGFPESYPYPTYEITFGDGYSASGDRQYTGEHWFHTYNTDLPSKEYTVNYTVAYDGVEYTDSETITVTSNTENFYVQVVGLNTTPISGANVTLWYNGVLQDWEGSSEGYGRAYFDVPSNRFVNGSVSKSGYQTAYYSSYVGSSNTWKNVVLYADDETPGSGDEYWNYIVTFRDANTLTTLSNVFINVYTDSGRTELYTSDNAPSGVWTGLLPNDTIFYFTASAADHITAHWSYTLSGSSVSVYKDLIPVTYGGLQPVLNIFVYDTGGTPLKDVGVTVDSDIDDGFHLTNVTGYARHFCDNLAYGSHRNYTITAEKGGYVTESSSVNVSTQQPTVYIFLEKSTVATVTPTGIYTPVVTPVWSGDGGAPGNIKEQLINTIMTQFGVSQLEANILMGILLTLLCAVIVGGGLASYGSGSGAGVGAMIGAVVGFSGSSIIGFFPIWILIVVIVLVFAAWFMFRGRDE